MAELLAQGPRPEDRWSRPLTDGELVVLGRAAGLWTVPWDAFLSRRHAELVYRGGRLSVRQLETARNPVFFHGQRAMMFELSPGEHFVIGSTTFTLSHALPSTIGRSDLPAIERTFSAVELAKVAYRDADRRMEALGRLPDVIIGAANERELYVSLTNVLLAGIRSATVAALVTLDAEGGKPRVLHWERRRAAGAEFRPSERLIADAIHRRRQGVVYWWRGEEDGNAAQSLRRESSDWAFCVPVRGETCRGWGLYVAGNAPTDESGLETRASVDEDVKYGELVASILGALRAARSLQRKHSSLTQFFSPAVLGKFAEEDPELALEARACEVSVLFCDLRGFSRRSEIDSGDLLRLLERVSKALGVMTSHILDNGGVVGDFQGDAAMGFWGWPVPQPDRVRRACLAALGIRLHFESAARRAGHPLAGFRVGIGIATGTAVAGKIGTVDQAKIGVFGPIVNLASRLEGMSKTLQAPIVLDEVTAQEARRALAPNLARVRRIARIKPYGLETAVDVSELLPPQTELPDLTDENIRAYEAALDAFIKGDWEEAFALLHEVPSTDRVKDFLTVTIAQHDRASPVGWDGVIAMTAKR